MKINAVNKQNFRGGLPTILSKNKMQTYIERTTGISRWNRLAHKTNQMYFGEGDYIMVLIKYLSTKLAGKPLIYKANFLR